MTFPCVSRYDLPQLTTLNFAAVQNNTNDLFWIIEGLRSPSRKWYRAISPTEPVSKLFSAQLPKRGFFITLGGNSTSTAPVKCFKKKTRAPELLGCLPGLARSEWVQKGEDNIYRADLLLFMVAAVLAGHWQGNPTLICFQGFSDRSLPQVLSLALNAL